MENPGFVIVVGLIFLFERKYSGPIFWNYGFVPQTLEDKNETFTDSITGKQYIGDDDPIDVVELSTESMPTGSIRQVSTKLN